MTDEIEALREEIAYLRERLAEQLDDDLIRILNRTFGLPTAEARLVAALFRARGVVRYHTIERAVITDRNRDYASPYTMSVFTHRIRKRLGADFIVTIRLYGLALSDRARLAIAKAITNDAELATFTDIEVTPFKRNWTDSMVEQLRALREEGKSYRECARIFHVSRNAIASIAWRRLGESMEAAP